MEIRKIRQQAYLTQKRFAEKLNVSLSTVRGWESGLFSPNITQKGKLKEFCKENDIDWEEEI